MNGLIAFALGVWTGVGLLTAVCAGVWLAEHL